MRALRLKHPAIYTRISLDQGTGDMAVERQEEACRMRARMAGVEIPEGRACVYEDLSKSAYSRKAKRPAYDRLVADIRAGLVDCVFVWDLDRLTRQPRQIDTWYEFAIRKMCIIFEANGSHRDLSNPDQLMQARIRADVAENESNHKGERQALADRQRRLQGVFHGGKRPTGYTSRGEVIPEEAEVVRAVFDAFCAGAPIGEIVRALGGEPGPLTQGVPELARPSHRLALEHNARSPRTAHEVPAPQPWSHVSVTKMLRNPRYAGFQVDVCARPADLLNTGGPMWYEVDEDAAEDADEAPAADDRPWWGGRVAAEDGGWLRGAWEPIVDEETWLAAQRILDEPGRATYTRPAGERRHLGSGLYRCGACGRPVRLMGTLYGCPEHGGRTARIVDAHVERVIERVLARPDLADAVALGPGRAAGELARIDREIERERRRIRRAQDDYASEAIRADDLALVRERAERRIEELRRERAEAAPETRRPPALVGAPSPAEAFRRADLETRRAVIDTLCTVEVVPRTDEESWVRNITGEGVDLERAVRFRWKTSAVPITA